MQSAFWRVFCLFALASPQVAAMDYEVELLAPADWQESFAKHLDIIRFQGDARMDQTQLERIYRKTPEQISQILAAQGYFSPKIKSHWQTEPSTKIIIEVEHGKRVHIDRVDLKLSGAIENDPDFALRLEEMRQATAFESGLPFHQNLWDSGKQQALARLMSEKYPAAKLEQSRAEIELDQASANLRLHYESGQAFRFGQLKIEGVQSYPLQIVENLKTFYDGEFYSQQSLLDFQSALQKTPYFSSVFVETKLDHETQRVPVTVRVEEAEKQNLSAGLGYGTNSGGRGELRYQHHNVARRGWLGSLLLRAEETQRLGEFRLSLPQTDKKYQDILVAEHRWKDVQNLRTSISRAGAFRSRLANDIEVNYGVQYLRERARRKDEAAKDRRALLASYHWHQKRFDDEINPRDGYAWRLELSGGSRSLLSSTDVMRAYLRGVHYVPLGRRELGFLTLRGEVGRVWARRADDVPQELLFRVGGTSTVRGYAYESLGVHDGETTLGGRVMFAASAEYQYPITERWGAAIFYDAGDAADTWERLRVHRGFGLGARWASPVGPLALDLAYGQNVNKARMHFSVNLSF